MCILHQANCIYSQQSLCHIHNQLPVYRTSHRTLDYSGVTLWFIKCHLHCKTYRGIFKWTLKQKGWEGMVLINLTQQKEKWQAVEHMVMNFVLGKLWGISWLAEELLAPLYGCWPMTLHYLYHTAVGWSNPWIKSILSSWFHNILAKISDAVNCNKYPASFVRYI